MYLFISEPIYLSIFLSILSIDSFSYMSVHLLIFFLAYLPIYLSILWFVFVIVMTIVIIINIIIIDVFPVIIMIIATAMNSIITIVSSIIANVTINVVSSIITSISSISIVITTTITIMHINSIVMMRLSCFGLVFAMTASEPPSKKPRRTRLEKIGSLDDAESMEGWPSGFSSVKEMFEWPSVALKTLLSDTTRDRKSRLEQLVAGGVDLFSFYSGKGSTGTCFEYFNTAFREAGLLPPDKHKGFHCIFACDSCKECRKVLKSMQIDDQPVFKHVMGELQSLQSSKSGDLIHNVLQSVDSGDVNQMSAAYALIAEGLDQLLEENDFVNPLQTAHCYRCDEQCPLFEDRIGKYKCVEGGSSCEDFSPLGLQHGEGGEKMLMWVIFKSLLKADKPDFLFLENSHQCPEDFHINLADELEMGIITGIEKLNRRGVRARRPRRYTFLWNPQKSRCDGSFEEYDRMFARRSQFSAQDLWLSSDLERQSYMRKLAAMRGEYFHEDVRLPLQAALTCGENERLQQHFVVNADDPSTDTRSIKCGLDGSYFTSIDQNGSHCSSGCYLPTMTKHSKILSLPVGGEMKIATPKESLIFLGENCVSAESSHGISKKYPCLFQHLLDEDLIPEHKQVEMSGNAMHMISVGQFMLYCLSSVQLFEE